MLFRSRIEDLVFLDGPSRVAKCLLDLKGTRGVGNDIELTQEEIAAFAGATRAFVNRVLADLEHEGVIAVSRRHIAIKDEGRLRQRIHY